MYDITTLNDMLVSELKEIAAKLDINAKSLKKQDLVYKILEVQALKPTEANQEEAPEKPKPTRERPKRTRENKPADAAPRVEAKKEEEHKPRDKNRKRPAKPEPQ